MVMARIPESEIPKPRFSPSYPSGRHKLDGLIVLGACTTVADLKDAIWWLFYGLASSTFSPRTESTNGHGMWVQSIIENLGQGDHQSSELRDPESLLRCVQNIQSAIDTKRDERARAEAAERAEYERLKAKYESL